MGFVKRKSRSALQDQFLLGMKKSGGVGAQPDWALGLTLIRQVLIRQVENIGPPDLDLHSYSLGRTLYPVLDCPCDRYVLV